MPVMLRVGSGGVKRFQRCRGAAQVTAAQQKYDVHHEHTFGTFEWRAFLTSKGERVSPWHDVPLVASAASTSSSTSGHARIFSFVNEIPKDSTAKLEVATKEEGNPVAQDTKKGKLRHYPFSIEWNYGLIPQTFEDPAEAHAGSDVLGDNDPVDALELSGVVRSTCDVLPVKVVGALALVDDGELDWKILTIDASDERAAHINGPQELEQYMPGEIARVHQWFRDYKKPDGKPENEFLYSGECTSREYAEHVVDQSHEAWRKLFSRERSNEELQHSLWSANPQPATKSSAAAAA